jgi:hypothetical protein
MIDAGDRALLEGMDIHECADECHFCLQVGDCKDNVRFESEDFRDAGRNEC